ncbi:hypothetical protein NQ317_006080 [Molorchus minor]|uniref:Uncharacterized protein n=1 Tax=Molorchus minor TaxID=1323400 RepID=A0ABQ9JS30_9CUCU|nr:hypothetical protein NQ317_006080 [Molorchus minor]
MKSDFSPALIEAEFSRAASDRIEPRNRRGELCTGITRKIRIPIAPERSHAEFRYREKPPMALAAPEKIWVIGANAPMYPPSGGSIVANGVASPPTPCPAATHLPAWKKLLKRIGGQSFGDLGKIMAVMKGNIVNIKPKYAVHGIELVHFYRPHAEKILECIKGHSDLEQVVKRGEGESGSCNPQFNGFFWLVI